MFNIRRLIWKDETEDWINPPEPKMGYNGYYFELDEEDEDEVQ